MQFLSYPFNVVLIFCSFKLVIECNALLYFKNLLTHSKASIVKVIKRINVHYFIVTSFASMYFVATHFSVF